MNFQELKQEILQRAEKARACSDQYERAKNAENIEELIEVIKDNLSFVEDENILPKELIQQFEKPELFGIGKENSGLFNSGNHNSGNHNSENHNSGNCNNGYCNNGYCNNGYCNNGYCNNGVFCNRKYEDKIIIFNRESDMTWGEWINSKAYYLSFRLEITKWVNLKEMTDKEKKENPKAETANGYLKVYEYKEAWGNLWKTFTEEEKQAFTTLPNFDSEVFEDITGIRI